MSSNWCRPVRERNPATTSPSSRTASRPASPPVNDDIRIRPATPADSAALVALFAQLGYPNDAATIERRLRSRPHDSAALIALRGDLIVGLVGVQLAVHLAEGEMAEIAALIVDEANRGNGTGAALLRAAEAWAAERGARRIRVRSNVIRQDAHRFYERENYAPVKDQRVFDKRV